MDSRQYIVSFAIHSPSEVPPEFVLPPDLHLVWAGVFLPQDDPDWLGRRKYPARVLLQSAREVVVAAHPSAADPLVRIPLDSIQTMECGRILLLGWIGFSWGFGEMRLPYNTRTRGPIEAFLKSFMDQWLPLAPGLESRPQDAFGKALSLKFEHARSVELLPGERPLAQFFHPAALRTRRRWISRVSDSSPGDLLMMTTRRLVWITESHRRRYTPYGTVSRSVPLALLAGVECARTDREGKMVIALRSGDSWRVPLAENELREAREFAAAVRNIEERHTAA